MTKSDTNSKTHSAGVSDGSRDSQANGGHADLGMAAIDSGVDARRCDTIEPDLQFIPDFDAVQAKQHEEVNSITVLHHQFVDAAKRIGRCHKYSRSSREPLCLCICGEAGTGKSTVKEFYAARYPRVSCGSVEKVPILHVTIPEGPSPKSLVETLLRDLGDPAFDTGNTVTKTDRLYRLLSSCSVECIMLDEFQHFVEPNRPRLMCDVADWLKNLTSSTKIPVVLFGLERCIEVFRQNVQLARRFSNRIFLNPFVWDDDESQRELLAFLTAVQEELPFTRVPNLAGDDLSYRLFVASNGYVGYLMKIIRGAAVIAIEERRNKMTAADIERAYVTEVWDATTQPHNPFAADFDLDKFKAEKKHKEMRKRFLGDKEDQWRAKRALGKPGG